MKRQKAWQQCKNYFFPVKNRLSQKSICTVDRRKKGEKLQKYPVFFLQANSHQTRSHIPTFPSINLCLRTLFESLSLQRQDEDAESVTAMQKIIFPGEFQKTVLLQNGGKWEKYFCNILNILINSDELFKEFAQISSSFLPVSSWLVSLAYISRQL